MIASAPQRRPTSAGFGIKAMDTSGAEISAHSNSKASVSHCFNLGVVSGFLVAPTLLSLS